MKIQNKKSVINFNSRQKVSEDTESNQESGNAAADPVQLSPRAKEFQRIKEVLEKVPEYREEKVAEIKDAVEKGNYNSDHMKAAENLIDDSLIDLLV